MICSRCKLAKRPIDFYRNSGSWCKECRKRRRAERQLEDPERARKIQREFYHRNMRDDKFAAKRNRYRNAWDRAHREQKQAARRAYVRRLPDAYVRMVMDWPAAPKPVVALKRLVLVMKRQMGVTPLRK